MSGPLTWADQGGTPALAHGLYVNGQAINGGLVTDPFDLRSVTGPAVLPTGVLTVTQHFWLGGEVPVDLNPFEGTLSFQVVREEDFWLFQRLASRGSVVALWMDLPWTTEWSIPGNSGQTWRLGREAPWDLPGIDMSTRAPACRVYTDDDDNAGSVLTRTAAAPSPGEFQLAESGGYLTLTTHADDTGGEEWLSLRYHPKLRMRISEVVLQYQEANNLVFEMAMREVLEDSAMVAAESQVA